VRLITRRAVSPLRFASAPAAPRGTSSYTKLTAQLVLLKRSKEQLEMSKMNHAKAKLVQDTPYKSIT